ncbi:hypothetical protein ACFVXC_41430 [Streptomyces sp. NPDC058257]|uniref:hypothetical protein n=1 Tax=Streptomyces sp. NPDC058257 TaxID=3346409 RepID=UPI0036E0BED2
MTDRPTAYATAPDLYEEHQELVRTMAQLPLRERLVRRAALADRETLDVPEADGKAVQSVLSAALKLAAHDQAHGTAAGPVAPQVLGPGSPTADLRAYIRQEYGAWGSPAEQRPAVWLVTRAEDPGATPAEDEATGRAYAEARYREDEDPDEPAVLRWDADGELIDETLDPSYPYTGWTVRQEQVIRAADLPTTK